jgi:hypothetical protein
VVSLGSLSFGDLEVGAVGLGGGRVAEDRLVVLVVLKADKVSPCELTLDILLNLLHTHITSLPLPTPPVSCLLATA